MSAPPHSHAPRQMLGVGEVAQLLGITRVAVLAAIHRGDIPARRIGRAYLIPQAAAERLLTAEPRKKGAPSHERS